MMSLSDKIPNLPFPKISVDFLLTKLVIFLPLCSVDQTVRVKSDKHYQKQYENLVAKCRFVRLIHASESHESSAINRNWPAWSGALC